MIEPGHPELNDRFHMLYKRVQAQGVEQWLQEKLDGPSVDGLVYLCKFAFFTGIITKAEIGRLLEISPRERRDLVKGWYDDHREKGCGTC